MGGGFVPKRGSLLAARDGLVAGILGGLLAVLTSAAGRSRKLICTMQRKTIKQAQTTDLDGGAQLLDAVVLLLELLLQLVDLLCILTSAGL